MRAAQFCLLAFLGLAVTGSVAFPRGGGARESNILADIRTDGTAQFLSVNGTNRTPMWTVTCRVQLRGCTARAPGLVLTADRTGVVRLAGYAPWDARISALNYGTSRSIPKVFNEPVDDDVLAILARPGTSLVIERGEVVLLRTQTDGIAMVAAYLRWLARAADRGVRDARAWSAPVERATAGPSALLAAYAPVDPDFMPQPIPRTKPQVEFAIRAQNGASFFDPTGH
ncbi:hypothetical protein [Pseudaestuariivita atlantica]|uniref:Uncharacterized protein n=1 Tax=Pseudaestuariivita atlantica TaxID=1317121 RepID=A0A0L1JPK5_9RHOB|nr:hypothetical protein [Pseudaestuariivita atlantica]KNG93647.1 hypothetical protein ATO11_10610 [Pseudaestuariivita atlantica]